MLPYAPSTERRTSHRWHLGECVTQAPKSVEQTEEETGERKESKKSVPSKIVHSLVTSLIQFGIDLLHMHSVHEYAGMTEPCTRHDEIGTRRCLVGCKQSRSLVSTNVHRLRNLDAIMLTVPVVTEKGRLYQLPWSSLDPLDSEEK